VLALLRHDQSKDEVKQLCIEQLDDFLRERLCFITSIPSQKFLTDSVDTVQFVDDVFTALARKAFRSVNSTLTGGGLSVHIPTRQDSPPPMPSATSASPRGSTHRDRSAGQRSAKRSYFDRDEPDEDERYKPLNGRDRKMARRGAGGSGRWSARGGLDANTGRGGFQQPQLGVPAPNIPGQLSVPLPFGMPSVPPVGTFPPWMPPPNPNDPMAAFLAAQAVAAWGFPAGGPDGKLDGEKKIIKKVGERCKDYDEKGFCMKGDMCPYEHGVDHIVVQSQELKSEGSLHTTLFVQHSKLIDDLEYDPNDSMLFSTSSNAAKSGRGGARGRGSRGSLRGGRGGRAGFSTTGPNFDHNNTKLVVEQIPEDKLSESTIREFFNTFGTVESVEIHQHKNLAILKFTTWDMAKAAYDSPAPIFDNRFVKVFWCKPPENADATSPTNGFQNRRFSTPRSEQPMEEPKIDIEEVKRKQEELQKAHEEKMAKKKANEEAAKELQKRTEELLMLQQEEKRKLMEKLAKKHVASAKKTASASPATPGLETQELNGASHLIPDKAKADATTAALKAQLEALQAEAEALGIDQNESGETFDLEGFRGRGRGRGRFATAGRGYVPRGRGFSSTYRGRGTYTPRGRGGIPTMKLDNRTKRVAVTIPDMKGDKEEEFRHYLIVCFLRDTRGEVFFFF